MWASILLLATAGAWTPGVEREVDEGTYMRFLSEQEGWRIWRIETKDHLSCKAVKAARGRSHPKPIGVSSLMYGDTPFLEVWGGGASSTISYRWFAARFGDVKIQYRKPGERFWEDVGVSGFNPDGVGEVPIEINVSSWEYPAISHGRVEEKAIFDLAGLAWAKDQLKSCPIH